MRFELATRADARPEVLYFLAADASADVRRAVAENPAAPRRADQILASDSDEEVRIVLARKIGKLVPGLNAIESERLQDLTFGVLTALARDQLPRVRRIIAEEIKHAINVPRDVVARLARDVESTVSTPILQYSVLLTDEDLLEVVANARSPEVLASVSQRERLSSSVCDAIVATGNEGAIASLLANHGAQIREDTLDSIIGQAPQRVSWHRPLVHRPQLSSAAIRRIAGFVAAALLDDLATRADLDPETERFVRQRVKERLKEESSASAENEETARGLATAALEAGTLDDAAVLRAAENGERAFIAHALALRSAVSLDAVRMILRARAARPLAALCWRANLSMRTAVGLQRTFCRLKGTEVLNPRGGADYPMVEEEMGWFVDYFADRA